MFWRGLKSTDTVGSKDYFYPTAEHLLVTVDEFSSVTRFPLVRLMTQILKLWLFLNLIFISRLMKFVFILFDL